MPTAASTFDTGGAQEKIESRGIRQPHQHLSICCHHVLSEIVGAEINQEQGGAKSWAFPVKLLGGQIDKNCCAEIPYRRGYMHSRHMPSEKGKDRGVKESRARRFVGNDVNIKPRSIEQTGGRERPHTFIAVDEIKA